MKTSKTLKAPKHPAPDVAGAVKTALARTADWVADRARDEDLFGSRPTHVDQALALSEARALAAAYIRKGAEG